MQDNEPINITYGQLSDMINRIEQIPSLFGEGAPTGTTPAFHLGQTYVDTLTGKSYYCSGIIEESGAPLEFNWQEGGKTYVAGQNVQINGNEISATDTTYTAGTGLNLNGTQFNVDTSTIAQKSDIKDATLTIQRNGSQVGTFSANASSNSTINITVPTNNNELTNGAGYQNSTQVQNAINSAIAGITSFDYQVVSTLPASGVKGTIYLVPADESGTTDNYYEEYIWIVENNVGHWEKIGTTDIDLSDYATKDYVDQSIAGQEVVSQEDWEALFGQTIENVNGVGL